MAAMETEVGKEDLRDPAPDINHLFAHYNEVYFKKSLRSCVVKWSSFRMKSCTGACKYLSGGVCEIRLSEPLLKYRRTADLKNTLLHEMIHAFLWICDKNKKHSEHGPSFEAIMRSINSSRVPDHQRPSGGYSITIYHEIQEDADSCRIFAWLVISNLFFFWHAILSVFLEFFLIMSYCYIVLAVSQCDSCGDFIKRDVNRKPSASDCSERLGCAKSCRDSSCHWHKHKMSCSGSYIKIAEPPGHKGKKEAGAAVQENQESFFIRRKTKRLHELDEMKNCPTKQSGGITKLSQDDPNMSGNIASSGNDLKRKAQSEELMVIKSEIADDDPQHTAVPKRPRTSVYRNQKNCNLTKKKKSRKCKDQCQVMSAWLNYYAVEETDEDIEPLINKRTERRKILKLLQTAPEVAQIHGEFPAHGGSSDGDGHNSYTLSYDGNIASWSDKKLLDDGCASHINCPARNVVIDISDD